MSKYRFYMDATSVDGWHAYICDADTKQEAMDKANSGDFELEQDDVMVTGMDEPYGFEKVPDDTEPYRHEYEIIDNLRTQLAAETKRADEAEKLAEFWQREFEKAQGE